MSDNNWPDPARPGVPPSEGFWWLMLPLDIEAIRYFNGEIWRIGGQLAAPKDFAKYTLIGPCLTPAEVEARVQQTRRDALEEAIEVLNDYVRCATNDHHAAKTSWDKNHLKGHVKAAKTILAAIRALGGEGDE
jgi:hypothetical protein